MNNAIYLAAPGSTAVSNLDFGDGTLAVQASPGVTDLYGVDDRANTFIWTPGDGSDSIYDFSSASHPVNTLRLAGVTQSNVQLARVGYDLVVTDTATGESITVKYEFPDMAAGAGIDRLVFDDGTVWNRATLNANAVIYGTSGNDTLYGSADPEIFDSLAGDDMVYGGGGGDIFIDRAQSGNDTFYENVLSATPTRYGDRGEEANAARSLRHDLIVERLIPAASR